MFGLSSNRSLSALACIPWDVLVIGGGITGAGVLYEAARRGLRVLLVEQNDFASGTSSRSSKLVHGGLHYLKRLDIGMARGAIRSRDRMVSTMAGLVNQTDFLLPTFSDERMPPPWQLSCLLSAYDLLSGRVRFHRRLQPGSVAIPPAAFTPLLSGAFTFSDATTDDARLVLHIIGQGCRRGGHALNYVTATDLMRNEVGRVDGVRLLDRETSACAEIRARVVVNATGPWADRLRGQLARPPSVRLVRGSHLVFPHRRLPIRQAVATLHPVSHSPIYFIPWEGVTLVGSTAVEHAESLDDEPRITPGEAIYLLESVNDLFPSLGLTRSDIQATYSGVRPIVDTDTADPAQASRQEAIWSEDGLLTVTGGKLTTFLSTARHVLKKIRDDLPELKRDDSGTPAAEGGVALPSELGVEPATAQSMLARYGIDGLVALVDAPIEDRASIPGLHTCRAEMRWILQTEAVRHLDDLLLRRLRIGLTAEKGGIPWLDQMRPIVQTELGWDDAHWDREAERYQTLWLTTYGVPDFDGSFDKRN